MKVHKSTILQYLHGYNRVLLWVVVYIAFAVMGLQHTSLGYSLAISLQTILPMILVACGVQYFLIPHFLQRRRTVLYFILSILLIVALCFLTTQYDQMMFEMWFSLGYEPPRHITDTHAIAPQVGIIQSMLKNVFLLMSTFTITTGVHLSAEKHELEQQIKEEKLSSEIRYLKAQINPHFLFNALNNIYSMAYTHDERTPDSVLRLSEMLRFVIDDCQNDHVALCKELHYIENYIDFQSFRTDRKLNVSLETEIANPNFPILPMLLQPLVENCFKHSNIFENEEAYICIKIKQNDELISFVADNTLSTHRSQDSERIGIGMANVQKRLRLHFGEKSSLKISEQGNNFHTELIINI